MPTVALFINRLEGRENGLGFVKNAFVVGIVKILRDTFESQVNEEGNDDDVV